MKLFISAFIITSTLCCAMDQKYTALTSIEKISLLNSITAGTLKAHDRYIEFPTFFKYENSEVTYFRSHKDIFDYLKKVTHHCKRPNDREVWYTRAGFFAFKNPDFLKGQATEETNKKFKSILSQIFAIKVWRLAGQREKNWRTFLDALNSYDKKSINDLILSQCLTARVKPLATPDKASLDH